MSVPAHRVGAILADHSGTVETAFIECAYQTHSDYCGNRLLLGRTEGRTDKELAAEVKEKGWTVVGFYGWKRTRCPEHKGKRSVA